MTDITPSAAPSALIGWREWLGLPKLNIARVKAKIDTGARSSALHAFDIQPFRVDGKARVRFKVHPLQRQQHTIEAEADLLEERMVRDSGGHTQQRPVIMTTVQLGDFCWPIELTLTNRDAMGFRMLLGRQAVRQRFLVDPGRSYLLSSAAPATSHPV
ncbi:ATP-dependent zinc protease [Romeria aff. gracilis LEGE 07310]|uniref:ATP-dependent zinc protease n=1 Tax=Vasconcelosia minhoensis LEGE 07310 TaxID=915328 RepID=A0A8J7DP40_9CYAN|nr:ATP-dependent zinc protease [Romeria gracilis]MBE9080496.1 ATP-dependent zinc protease [Romeria aff. gracilis LEGE 07310]